MVNCIRKEPCLNPYNSFINGFTFDKSGLTVSRYSVQITQTVHFKDSLYFNIIDEGDALQQHGEDKGDNDPNTDVRLRYWFYAYDQSNLIDWFNEQTHDIYKGKLKHFFIYTENEMVEVLSQFEPEMSFSDYAEDEFEVYKEAQ